MDSAAGLAKTDTVSPTGAGMHVVPMNYTGLIDVQSTETECRAAEAY